MIINMYVYDYSCCYSICSFFCKVVLQLKRGVLRNDCLKFDPRRRGVPQVYFIESKWDEPVPERSPSQGDVLLPKAMIQMYIDEKIIRTILIALST